MANYGYTFTSGDTVTPLKLNNARTISDIATADIADATSTTTGVTNSKLRHSAALSVIGNSTNAAAAPADMAAANDNEVFRRSGTSLGFGLLATANISDSAVTAAKIADRTITPAKLSGVSTIDQKTGNYTLVLDDRGKVLEVNSASGVTITVPTNASVAFATGAMVAVTRRGAGDVTIAGSGVTLRSDSGRLKIGKQYAAVVLLKIGTDEWMVLGNLKA
jgi:hypothetical protein